MIGRPLWQPIARRVAQMVSAPRCSAAAAATRGPELIDTAFGSWTFSAASVTGDATGITFTAATSGDNARLNIATEDNATYEVIVTVSTVSAGGVVPHLYGPTASHHGAGSSITTATTSTQQIITTGASSIVGQIRLIATTGASLKVTAVSVKKVLA